MDGNDNFVHFDSNENFHMYDHIIWMKMSTGNDITQMIKIKVAQMILII
jgi:hypothetical protein